MKLPSDIIAEFERLARDRGAVPVIKGTPYFGGRPPTHMSTNGQPPLCGETKEPIYVSDNTPLNPNGCVTCFACLSLAYGKRTEEKTK